MALSRVALNFVVSSVLVRAYDANIWTVPRDMRKFLGPYAVI